MCVLFLVIFKSRSLRLLGNPWRFWRLRSHGSLLRRGEGTVDWDTVASNCSIDKCLPNSNKRISSKNLNWEIWARWRLPTVPSPLLNYDYRWSQGRPHGLRSVFIINRSCSKQTNANRNSPPMNLSKNRVFVVNPRKSGLWHIFPPRIRHHCAARAAWLSYGQFS